MITTITTRSFTKFNTKVVNKFRNEVEQLLNDLYKLYKLNKLNYTEHESFDSRNTMMFNLSNYNLGVNHSLMFKLNLDYYKEVAVLEVYNFMDGKRTDIEVKFDDIERVISSDEIFEYLNNYMENVMNYVHTLEEKFK